MHREKMIVPVVQLCFRTLVSEQHACARDTVNVRPLPITPGLRQLRFQSPMSSPQTIKKVLGAPP
jgi:hypothetical protein